MREIAPIPVEDTVECPVCQKTTHVVGKSWHGQFVTNCLHNLDVVPGREPKTKEDA